MVDFTFARHIELCYGKRFDQDDSVNSNKVWISKKAGFIQHLFTVAMYGIIANVDDFDQFKQAFLESEHQAIVAVLAIVEWNEFRSAQKGLVNQFQILLENEKDTIVLKIDGY